MRELRKACATVAQRAEAVRIEHHRIAPYAASLAVAESAAFTSEDRIPLAGHEQLAAYWLTLDAINFGSGWFPTLRKRDGLSGYATVAAGMRERALARGPLTVAELEQITAAELAALLGQDAGHPLMGLFAASLRDLGAHVGTDCGGSFAALVQRAGGSAVALARELGGWDSFADCSRYQELELPFLKRAQIAAADLHRAAVAQFGDLASLTMFADNLVPHVLRLDGVLRFDPSLVAHIERGELIDHGSPEEIEIRACALHAVELIVAARGDACAAAVDQLLWQRGGGPRYKASPRHRSRCTAY
ncbi:MAG TPA: queuosine salvage family protein [Solirubrobacteraceae bacterium]